jgi:hypothetical protein
MNQLAQFNPVLVIEVENAYRGFATFCFSDEHCAAPTKMTIPILRSRIEQCNYFISDTSGEIRAFAQIATVATPRQIRNVVFPAVLFGNDVFNVKCIWLILFVDATVLATVASTSSHLPASRGIHPPFPARTRRAWACRIAITFPTVT